MTKCAPMWRLLLSLSLAFFFVGCSQLKRSGAADEKDPYYLEGKRRESGMDWDGAIQSYERALQSNPNNAAAHLALGILYAEKKNDFASAVYHYQKHLNFDTNSPRAVQIKQQIDFCKRELAKSHSYALINRDVQREMERLTMTNEVYARRIQALEGELARGPRYITNTVTNFVAMPDLDQKGGRGLTRPTTIVEPPEPEPEQVVQTPRTTPAEQTRTKPSDETRVASSVRQETPRENSSRDRNTRDTSRTAAQRNTGSGASRSTPVQASSRIRTVHTVKPGDTLQRVAQTYGVSISDLRAANPGLGSGARAGQKINIPSK
jgi:LysM repeat protein